MADKKKLVERRRQQSREIQANQKVLRESIAETARLVAKAEKMLRRHRREREEEERGSEN